MKTLFYLSILLFAGLVFARIFGKLSFPDVTGYLIGGIIIGPSVLGIIPRPGLESLALLSEIALAFIAFSIGSELKLGNLKKFGSKIFIVTIAEALGAFVIVTLGCLLIFRTSLAFALILGSISCATAPAATLMVIRQYQARGNLVDILVPVVALDDAACIIAFGICSSIAQALVSQSDLNPLTMVLSPLWEIFLSLFIGALIGLIYLLLAKKCRHDKELMSLTFAIIFVATATALYLEISSLLLLMATGMVVSNLSTNHQRYTQALDAIGPPVFMGFFVLSGADLNLSALPSVGLLGLFYIGGRVLGKILGSYTSSRLVGFSKEVQTYLGLTLTPQAGVAIGLSAIALKIFPGPPGQEIRTIILAATIVYELFGPIIAKIALEKSGCIDKA